MKLPHNDKELAEIFRQASLPEVPEFSGEYWVDMLTGIPSLRRLSHRKSFYSVNNGVGGNNMLFSNLIFGHFSLEKGTCREPDLLDVILINYHRPENSFITRRIVDHVRRIKQGELYIGRANYEFMGGIRFLGYFSLSKIQDQSLMTKFYKTD